ncbi:MAG: translocation/assembly module TamB domain-containing protein [Chitinophagaceae bacterium]|nr:translocation/assembly module TamB domain-containing protein [Chitinophagaceae bacterium]
MFANASAYWVMDAQLSGTMKELQISDLQMTGPDNLRASLAGSLRGVTEPDNLYADLSIREIYVTKNAIHSFVPASQMPENIQIPAWMRTTGSLIGNAKEARVSLRIDTDQGMLDMNGDVRNANTPESMQYAMQVDSRALNLGYILADTSMYGPLTASFKANGKGTDIKTMYANLDGNLESMRLNGYTYSNMPITASMQNQVAEINTGLQDPNLHFALTGKMDLRNEYPSLVIDAKIDSAKLQATNWTSDPWIIRTDIHADFVNVDPDNLDGQLLLTQLLAVKEEDRLQLDTVRMVAGTTDSSRFLRLESEIANVDMKGRYKLTQMAAVIQQLVEPHYAMGGTAAKPDPYDFTLNATINDRPLLRSLVPGLETARGVELTSHFSDQEGVDLQLKADQLKLQGNEITGLVMSAETTDSALLANVRLSALRAGSMELDSTIVTAELANNTIDFDAVLKDRTSKDRYRLGGLLRQDAGDMVLQLDPEQLLLNYEPWQMSDSNRIRIGDDGIWARNFELRNGQQLLSLNSKGQTGSSPLHVSLKDFQVATLTAIALSDSTMIDGTMTGEIDLENLNTNPAFTGEILLNDLSFKRDTIGNLSARFTNAGRTNAIRAEVELSGRGNDVSVEGMYNAANATLDLAVDLKKLPMQTVEAFSGGAVRYTSGYLDGPFKITGPVSAPVVKGELRFNNTRMNVAMLNSFFSVDKEKLEFTGDALRFNQFQVKDSSGNELTLDGQIKTKNYTNYNFDLDLRARNFQALNSTKKDNKLFWGRLFFNTNLKLKGTEAKPVLDGRLAINDKTMMTIVLPQSEPGVVEREGVIEFVDMDAPVNDSLFLAAYDSMNVTGITGMDISLNVTIDKGADFTLIIDEGNGDFLNVQGEAQLSAGVDPSGKITMVGTYELEQGAYELSFNMLRKKFDIQKGSKIVWEGEPTSANVDITAKYTATTAPLDLVKGQLDENTSREERNMYLQRLPFDVNLRMQGELMRPQITFDIVLPTNRNYGVASEIVTNVRTKLEQLRQSPGDMNKQVFSLLLLNRFVAENPFSSAGAPSASTMVRQSVSKLLTEQLNRLAEGLINGVDINLGIEASDDYTTGTRQDRTDLNVGLSKRLMNDRLTVTVGSNFNLDGPQDNTAQANNIAGNVAIDYALSSDGRYKVRAYRKNDYQGVIDGFVVETGVSFIITLDFNEFNQIFRKRRRPAADSTRREQRTETAPAKEKENNQSTPAPEKPQSELRNREED